MGKFEYAGFWIRLWASVIDSFLFMLITYPVLYLIYGKHYFISDKIILGKADFIISFVLPCIGTVLFWVYKQATLGKMAIDSKIVDSETGEPVSTARLIGRYFAYFISAIPMGLGFLWIAFDNKKQGWHDKLSGTVVIRQRKKPLPVSFNNGNKKIEPIL